MIMKIEKLNDNQIRCTLTRADLAARELKLSELVCGGEKAKSLFHDMMEQASSEFGFEAEDTPLMIEAIPASADSVVLIITKVDNPDELDSKFSKFGVDFPSPDGKKRALLDKLEGAEDILDLIDKVKDAVAELPPAKEEKKLPRIRLFSFATLDCAIQASHLLGEMYSGVNTLYKDAPNNVYLLALAQSDHTTAEFNKICNMLSEFGISEKVTGAILAYLEEHCDVLIEANAVQKLNSI
jgi:adapter protein MecA 1/2